MRLEAKIETLAEALEAKQQEFNIKEFEVRRAGVTINLVLHQVSQLQSENLQLISYKRQVDYPTVGKLRLTVLLAF